VPRLMWIVFQDWTPRFPAPFFFYAGLLQVSAETRRHGRRSARTGKLLKSAVYAIMRAPHGAVLKQDGHSANVWSRAGVAIPRGPGVRCSAGHRDENGFPDPTASMSAGTHQT